MRKISIILILSTLPFETSFGQFISAFGFKGGLTYSTCDYSFSRPITFDTKYVTGISAGLFAEGLDSKYFSLLFESGYEQRGFAWFMSRTDEFGNYIGQEDWKDKTFYIYMGIGSKFKRQMGNFIPYLLIIPRMDIYLDYDVVEGDSFRRISNEELRDDILENFKRVNFGMTLAAGVECLNLLPFGIFGELNFSPGLLKSFSGNFVTSVRENYFALKLGFNILKKKNKNTAHAF